MSEWTCIINSGWEEFSLSRVSLGKAAVHCFSIGSPLEFGVGHFFTALCSSSLCNIKHPWFLPTKCQGHPPITVMTKTGSLNFQSWGRSVEGSGRPWLGSSTTAMVSPPDPGGLRGLYSRVMLCSRTRCWKTGSSQNVN